MIFLSLLSIPSALAQVPGRDSSEKEKPELPKEKETILGLYVTAREAFEMWNANPDNIKILDVRTPEEYIFIGHAEMAWSIPLAFQSYEWDVEKMHYKFRPIPDFLINVQAIAGLKDTLLVMCRSGGRSAMAVNLLAKAGFSNVFQITDGMEGDLVDDPESLFFGQHMKNGWKNSGLPWTYQLNPEHILLSKK